jgi:hypothetical protein
MAERAAAASIKEDEARRFARDARFAEVYGDEVVRLHMEKMFGRSEAEAASPSGAPAAAASPDAWLRDANNFVATGECRGCAYSA